jgi:hypothetical protein
VTRISVSSARLGWHWWQVDIGWYFIRMLEAIGLRQQRKTAQHTVNHDWQRYRAMRFPFDELTAA